ncbi:MAG: ABC transporter ATP-binding protein [Patescibacteria group bacterium]
MSGISVKNLSVYYKDNHVLKDVNFKAQNGEFVAIVGKSGDGKSTFLHALSGLVPYSGDISVPKNIGMVFQNHAVFPWLTVSGNIAFGLEYSTDEERVSIVHEHLKLAGLEDKKDKYPAELSGGQVQRIAIATSLAHSPDVLLMDEPYGSLDEHTRGNMQKWLLDVWAKHRKTIVFVTHSIEEAIFLADRVSVLNHGTFTHEFMVPFARPRREEVKFTTEFNTLRKDVFEALNTPATTLANIEKRIPVGPSRK